MKKRGRPKLDSNPKRLLLALPRDLWKRIERYREDDFPLPTRSEAIRRLLKRGLDAARVT